MQRARTDTRDYQFRSPADWARLHTHTNRAHRNPEVVEMAKRLETRFREEEAPIVVRFERLLEKIFQLEADMMRSMAKNLEALGRKEAS